MVALVRAELQKLFTTRLWWVMLISALLYSGFVLVLVTAFAGVSGSPGVPASPGRDTPEYQQLAWSSGSAATLFVMILGIVMVTAEYRYQTITGTFLTTPRRGRVVTAKLLAGLVVGVLFGLATLALTAVVVIPAVSLSGGEVTLTDHGIPRIAGGVLASVALYALFGIGLGALIRNQIGAIMAGVAWVFVVEAILAVVPALRTVGKWTPGGASNALINVNVNTGLGEFDLLPAWGGAAVLVAYALLFAAVASLTTLRRDIT
ncbi:ABC-type transport system involved in multi-copper enzyme maturation permease subunit [Thermocatellispora tengchongensis]|uniref:ABC-type transport system involved in multi-copper enzyme maturation permease subunit n=1 Tax=Thermocatellispora tengchongensis TaxID=1073253 RepID=A0A840PE69_9ACTN|nr:ABC transporter permease [Thermocatellispora tengchongensis]MBB5134335.1 ABC-type transport system involved in multi-copper enzyme maturation permease subunit [Thermocatellispora tengchongensis]